MLSKIITFVILTITTTSAFPQASVPVGAQFQVNTYTSWYQVRPAIGLDGAGGFVVVWETEIDWIHPGQSMIQGQRFDSEGLPHGSEFAVSNLSVPSQVDPDVSLDGAGGFVVVWQDGLSDPTQPPPDISTIRGQRFHSNGVENGGEFQVNSYTTFGLHRRPEVASVDSQGFVVVWDANYNEGESIRGGLEPYSNIRSQLFNSQGQPVGSSHQVNSLTTWKQFSPKITPNGNNGYFLVWKSRVDSGSSSERQLKGRQLDGEGAPLGDEFRVDSNLTLLYGFFGRHDVNQNGSGDMVAVWDSMNSHESDWDSSVQAQRFQPDGSRMGDQFQVNTFTSMDQRSPAVSPNGIGGFVVAWYSQGSPDYPGAVANIRAQNFKPDGNMMGVEFLVSSYTTDRQWTPTVAPDGNGGFVVVWVNELAPGPDPSDEDLQAQRFGFFPIFSDGFESGNTAAWSSTLPIAP